MMRDLKMNEIKDNVGEFIDEIIRKKISYF